jgi:hypothetical protein
VEEGRMDAWMNGWMDRWMIGHIHGKTEREIDENFHSTK